MRDPFDLVVVGDVNPDLVLTGDIEPTFGQSERILERAHLTVGGSGAITACAAARLGLRVAMCGIVGDDPLGRLMREELEQRGVDSRAIATDPSVPTGISVILARRDDRAILTQPGTIAALGIDGVDLELIGGTRHLHVSSYFLQAGLASAVAGLLSEARAAGATTSLDPNHDPTGSWNGALKDALASTTVFLPNEREAMAISGKATVWDAASELISMGPEAVAIKAGHQGAIGITEDEVVRSPTLEVEGSIDTTGAGDCFDAGFLTSWLARAPFIDALRMANACGALSTRALGGVDAQPTMDEVMRAIEHAYL